MPGWLPPISIFVAYYLTRKLVSDKSFITSSLHEMDAYIATVRHPVRAVKRFTIIEPNALSLCQRNAVKMGSVRYVQSVRLLTQLPAHHPCRHWPV